jgi:hypothetical protein
MMIEAARTSETSVDNYFTRQYIPEDNSEQRFESSTSILRCLVVNKLTLFFIYVNDSYWDRTPDHSSTRLIRKLQGHQIYPLLDILYGNGMEVTFRTCEKFLIKLTKEDNLTPVQSEIKPYHPEVPGV